MGNYHDLRVWQKAHALTLAIYRATSKFPQHELFGIVSQTRRACASIPSNIAEGSTRMSPADFARFLGIALGSASEVEYDLLLARDLGYLTNDDYETLLGPTEEVKRMLRGLIDSTIASSNSRLMTHDS